MSTRNTIAEVLAAADQPMTFHELALATGKSLSTVAYHVKRMRREGQVPRSRKRRNLSLVDGVRPAVARDRCAQLVEQLGTATTMNEVSGVYDGLVDLLEMLEVMAA